MVRKIKLWSKQRMLKISIRMALILKEIFGIKLFASKEIIIIKSNEAIRSIE